MKFLAPLLIRMITIPALSTVAGEVSVWAGIGLEKSLEEIFVQINFCQRRHSVATD